MKDELPKNFIEIDSTKFYEIDYKELLIKYIKHINHIEGYTYLSIMGRTEHLTEIEFKVLQELEKEIFD